jgi:hypothetical protein
MASGHPLGFVCRRCAAPQRRALAAPSAASRRWVTVATETANEAKCRSTKLLQKIKEANKGWQGKAERIRNGEEQNVMDILVERGFVKDTIG